MSITSWVNKKQGIAANKNKNKQTKANKVEQHKTRYYWSITNCFVTGASGFSGSPYQVQVWQQSKSSNLIFHYATVSFDI